MLSESTDSQSHETVVPGPVFELPPELEVVAERAHAAQQLSVGGLWGASQALLMAGLARRTQGPWLVMASSDEDASSFVEDLAFFGCDAYWLPAREGRANAPDAERVRRRLQFAQVIAGPGERRPRLIVASLLSLLQPVPEHSNLESDFLHATLGQRADIEGMLDKLVEAGYTRQPLAEGPGEISLRGDILDVFPFSDEWPLRIEFFDDEIESIRVFDPLDQRSIEQLKHVQISLAKDAGGVEDGDGILPSSLMAPTTVTVRIEPLRIEDKDHGLQIQSSSHARALLQLEKELHGKRRIDLQSLPGEDFRIETRSVQGLAVGARESLAELQPLIEAGERVIIVCQTEAEETRFHKLIEEHGAFAADRVETRIGSLSRGFRLPSAKLVIVNHRELAGVIGRRKIVKPRAAYRSRAIQSFFELKIADYVVHAVHGLARYEGLSRMRRGAGEEEHLKLVFADEVTLFVPASRIDLVQRYIGSGAGSIQLDKLGGTSFRKRKEKVERALQDLAADLLEVQAKRAVRTRDGWPADDELVREMIESFAYTDTPDQVKTDGEVRDDLNGPRPADRLICGDVGFGKTELAIRAAFRVVNGGGQVAVLVPTTVLAQQHFQVFSERLADFPVRVGMLSRYVTGKPAKETREATAAGKIDILIGTHRILSKDVSFAKLGLLIIDEEQRFGVTQKEHFKKMRAQIDLLTLTATPIPRTLHMSLAGVRDISALTTPPPGRQEIETILAYQDERELLRQAILREKNRDGQVFFLHNRVQSIHGVARELQELVPECSYALGHGQMGARELKRVMDSFTRGEVDVLVATTIIESGIDIPSAGTIIVDQADMFGLSELHQLRGRVGRGSHKAFCYLVIDRTKPLRQVAKDRLKALEEMTQLGAGFAISMKDLEIRGAGNILGPEQSGNIGAVGYDMYCRLLKMTIERMQAGGAHGEVHASEVGLEGCELELGVAAFLPVEWIASADTRLELVRELSEIHTEQDAKAALEMLRDRFGRPPREACNFVQTCLLKSQLEELGVRRLSWLQETYLLEYVDRVEVEAWLGSKSGSAPVEFRPVRTGVGHLVIPLVRGAERSAEQALEWVEGLLQREE